MDRDARLQGRELFAPRNTRKEREMKRMMAVLTIAAIAALVAFTGCGKEGPNDVDMDESAIRSFISNDTLWFNTGRHYEGEATDDSGGTSGAFDELQQGYVGPLGEITPLLWGRQILGHPNPQVTIDIVDDSAYVAWEVHNTGYFNIFAWDPDSGQNGEWVFIKKELNENK